MIVDTFIEGVSVSGTGIALLAAAISGGGRKAASSERSYDPSPGERFPHFWGYTDTRFEFCGPRLVRVTGNRYPLAGPPLPYFIPYVEQILDVALEPRHLKEPVMPSGIPAPRRNEPFLKELNDGFAAEHVSSADSDRLVHSHGQLSVDEIYRLLQGSPPRRLVDLVVYPGDEKDIARLVQLADRHDVALIPYGGGTNVSGALQCPHEEQRMVVSVDMRRMNRILEIDRENNWIVVEAGITGKELESLLEAEGLTTGHVPDSIELSTLGGWIATNASGMKRNRYGNIEDIVLEANLVTPMGVVKTLPVTPRNSIGVATTDFLFGSEGNFGFITRAVMQVHPLPEVRSYGSFIFPEFEHGVDFLRSLQTSHVRPASIRLINNTELMLGRAVSPQPSKWNAAVSRLKKAYLTRVKGFDLKRMVACTIVMEGSATEVSQQKKTLARLGKKAGGISGGAHAGKRGYETTFAIAYIRDFLNRFDIIGETFETSAPWSRIRTITEAVENELKQQCRIAGIEGRPYLAYRISQTYRCGVCIYFTMGFCARGLQDPVSTYQKIEHRLREVVLENGGSLSHHHGVGKIRSSFVPEIHSPQSVQAVRAIKNAWDPKNLFAAGNNLFGLNPDGPGARGGPVEETKDNATPAS